MKTITEKDLAWEAYVAAIHHSKSACVYFKMQNALVKRTAAAMVDGKPWAAAAYAAAAAAAMAAALSLGAANEATDKAWDAYNSFE